MSRPSNIPPGPIITKGGRKRTYKRRNRKVKKSKSQHKRR